MLQLAEAHDDVGDLHARVVDVVLDLDRLAPEAEQPAQRVAERRVPQVADVRRLVRVDGRVLDDGLPGGRRDRGHLAGEPRAQERGAVEVDVQVAVRRRDDARHAGHRAERRRDLLRDGAGRLAQPARQLEGERHRQVAQRALGRRLDHDRREVAVGEGVDLARGAGDALTDELVQRQNHGSESRMDRRMRGRRTGPSGTRVPVYVTCNRPRRARSPRVGGCDTIRTAICSDD